MKLKQISILHVYKLNEGEDQDGPLIDEVVHNTSRMITNSGLTINDGTVEVLETNEGWKALAINSLCNFPDSLNS